MVYVTKNNKKKIEFKVNRGPFEHDQLKRNYFIKQRYNGYKSSLYGFMSIRAPPSHHIVLIVKNIFKEILSHRNLN